jgi:hypothetical protein
MEVVSSTPRPLYPQGKSPWYPLDRRLGGPQSRSGRGGEEKIYRICYPNKEGLSVANFLSHEELSIAQLSIKL